MTDERLWTVPEIAQQLKTTSETVRRWIHEGKLKGFLPGGRKIGWRVRDSELRRFLER